MEMSTFVLMLNDLISTDEASDAEDPRGPMHLYYRGRIDAWKLALRSVNYLSEDAALLG